MPGTFRKTSRLRRTTVSSREQDAHESRCCRDAAISMAGNTSSTYPACFFLNSRQSIRARLVHIRCVNHHTRGLAAGSGTRSLWMEKHVMWHSGPAATAPHHTFKASTSYSSQGSIIAAKEFRARFSRDFTVPRLQSVISAISSYDFPSNSRSTNTCR